MLQHKGRSCCHFTRLPFSQLPKVWAHQSSDKFTDRRDVSNFFVNWAGLASVNVIEIYYFTVHSKGWRCVHNRILSHRHLSLKNNISFLILQLSMQILAIFQLNSPQQIRLILLHDTTHGVLDSMKLLLSLAMVGYGFRMKIVRKALGGFFIKGIWYC